MRYSNDPSQLGVKLGPKLAKLVSDTIVATKHKLLDTEHRARVISMQTIIDRAGHEIADLYRPVMQQVMQETDMPSEVREFLDKAISGQHQWHAVGGLLFQGSGAPSALSTIISNFLAPGVRFAVSKDPQLLPSNETLAQLNARGIRGIGDVYDYSAGQGYSRDLVDNLVEASKSYPDLDTLLQMNRRHLIDTGEANLALTRNGVPGNWHNALLALRDQVLSPADLADMVVRGIIPESEGATVAAYSGITASDFHKLVLDNGEPPGLMELLEAFRRGFIDQSRLEHGVLQSRYRNEWMDVILKLRYAPMSVADAVNANVQGHMSASDRDAIAQQNGLEPGQAAILYETAGEPLSRTEMEQLYNRGQATQAEVEQALRESRLKDKYVTQAFELHSKVLPIFTVERALRYGGMTTEQATRIVIENGYSKDDAQAIVSSGVGQRIETAKNKTVAAVEGAYEDNLIPQQDAEAIITGLGFSKEESSFILQAAEFRRQTHVVAQAVGSLRGKYVAHHMTKNVASGFLDALGVPATQRDFLLMLWDIERGANTRTLTEAQIVKAVKLKLIDATDGQQRLEMMGYNSIDAQLLLKGA